LGVTSEKIKKTGSKYRNAHKIVLQGIGGKQFEGYCLTPKKRGVYPVVITCTDRDEVLRLPDIDAYDNRIDLVISPRRSVIRNEAYYAGSYMDIVRAIDYVYGMKEADLKNIYLQG
jgi:cephalosporin-C deacetylase-like acetyl esterase